MTEVPRRMVLSALALGLTAAAGCGDRMDRGRLRLAAGEPGGMYLAFAELLAREISAAEPGLRPTVMPTNGSIENLQLLGAGKVDLACALADAAQAVTRVDGPLLAPVPMRAIGRIYENYLQLVVLATSPIRTLTDLAGRTVSLSVHGSGAELAGDRLLTAAGLTRTAVTVQHYRLSDVVTALEDGRIDALLSAGGVPTPALAGLSVRRGIRLLPLATALPALRSVYGPVYQPVTVPANAYGPAPEVTTIGTANLLVCRPDTDPAVTAAVARVLVTHAPKLVPPQVLGTQFLDPGSLIATAGIPLHPGAITAYRALHG
jgi:uncharacterized protein